MPSEPHVREATDADIPEIIDVCAAALGWQDREFDEQLFRWKHLENAFGRSLLLIAEDATGILAVRPLMRWRFRRADLTMDAARAVDTATRPDAQGRGLFRLLTEQGLEYLRRDGTGIVFNTPNDKSRPGYLKMGWREMGSVAFGIRPRSVAALPTILRARVAAEKRSLPSERLGIDTATGLDVAEELGAPLLAPSDQWQTDHTAETLRWRFASGPITYRWIPGPGGAGLIVRARRRGPATELLVAASIGAAQREPMLAGLTSSIQRAGADYAITPAGMPGTFTTSAIGPTLTMRTVLEMPSSDHRWQPGDIELF